MTGVQPGAYGDPETQGQRNVLDQLAADHDSLEVQLTGPNGAPGLEVTTWDYGRRTAVVQVTHGGIISSVAHYENGLRGR
jgi:hypothetical protein